MNSVGNAVIKVDNIHSVQSPQKRNSVRITTKDSYAVGSLWIFDLVHIPYGCSVSFAHPLGICRIHATISGMAGCVVAWWPNMARRR